MKCPACKLKGIETEMIVLELETKDGKPWIWYRCDKHTYPIFCTEKPNHKAFKQTKLF